MTEIEKIEALSTLLKVRVYYAELAKELQSKLDNLSQEYKDKTLEELKEKEPEKYKDTKELHFENEFLIVVVQIDKKVKWLTQ